MQRQHREEARGLRWARVWGALGLLCALFACDEGGAPSPDASGAPPDSALTDAAPTADADAELGAALGEPCGAAQPCAEGRCVAGRCAQPCEQARDCAAADALCVEHAGQSLCAPRCEAESACAPGQRCVTLGPALGYCAWPGPGAGGAPCAEGADCDSLQCSGGACLAACDGGGCAPDETCLALHTQSVCAPAGEGAAEALCERAADCRSGVCRGGRCSETCDPSEPLACPEDRRCQPYAQLALCERPCTDSAHCGPQAACVLQGAFPQCQTRGALPARAPCEADTACESLRCVAGRCAAPCAAQGACPVGEACVTDLLGALCVPAGLAALGAPCEAAHECATGLCVGGVCSRSCAQDPCPQDLLCARFQSGDFCVAPCEGPADCGPDALCDASLAERPACFWRGAAPVGAACQSHRACRSGRCVDARCHEACDASGECAAGLRCVSLAEGVGAACVPEGAAVPVGVACAAGPCAADLQCVAGLCQPSCAQGCAEGAVCIAQTGQCHTRCARAEECRPGRICAQDEQGRGYCADAGSAPVGASCAQDTDCREGGCVAGECRRPCACAPGTSCARCAAEARCVEAGGGRWCLPWGPGEAGAPCETQADCAGLPCVAGECAARCEAADCAPEQICVHRAQAWVCQPACDPRAPEACAAGACAPVGDTGVCVVGGGGGGRGAPCDASRLCAAPWLCSVQTGIGVCQAPCWTAQDCPEGQACRRSSPTQWGSCGRAGVGALRSACVEDAECASGLCEAGRCQRACADTADCDGAEPARCVDLARSPLTPHWGCALLCTQTADCPEGTACRRGGDGQGACW